MPPVGAYIDPDLLSGGAFYAHPVEWLRRGLVTNPNLILFGEGTMTVPRHVGMYMGHGLIIEAPHTGDVVKIIPLSRWAPLVATMRHIA